MSMKTKIEAKLKLALRPEAIDVVDESHLHEGHSGWRPSGETHFRVYLVCDAFVGKSRLERHRMVNTLLSEELADGLHALAIHAAAPGQS
ncbi:MAG: BolA family transcriptional regulator [Hyphomicrobiaceae bacterium]|nr:BolA family transcriptional regulator [Hyphomicrobiaceae bacterium]